MSPHRAPPVSVFFRFTCQLPVAVYLGGKRWVIGLNYYPKGKAAIVAVSGGKVVGQFAGGRHSDVEHALGAGLSIPLGTVRHRLALALAEAGKGSFKDYWQSNAGNVPE